MAGLKNRKNHEQKLTDTEKKSIDDRRKHAHSLDLQGFTNNEISEKLNVSESTVEKDLHEVRESIRNWFSELGSTDRYQAFVDASIHIEYAQKELWRILRDEQDSLKKSKILSIIVENATKYTELYKSSESYLNSFHFRQKDLTESYRSKEEFHDILEMG